MTYSSAYNPDRYTQISEILTKVQRLTSGERLNIHGLSPEEQARVRNLIYDWLHHMGLKAAFRLSVDGGTLAVQNRRLSPALKLEFDSPHSSKHHDEGLMGELIESYETAEALLECWVKEGRITESKRKMLKLQLEQIME